MTGVEISERVTRLFTDRMGIEIPSATTDLVNEGLLDSLALVDLLVHMEREFQVAIPLDQVEIDHFRTVERISRYLGSVVR